MKSSVVISLLLPLVVACQHGRQVASHDEAASSSEPMRYLAWLEGDLQNDYQPNREIAKEELERFEKKAPAPTDTDAYLEYLSVLDANGKATEAEAKIKKYLADNPNETRAVFLLGVHYLRTNKKELARYFFNNLEKNPNFAWKSLLYNNLGMLALNDKDRGLALSYFEKAVKAQPPTAAPYVNLGALYLQSRSYEDAQKVFSRAYEIDQDFEDAALGLGSALEGMGKFNEAHQTYANFIDGHPEALSVLYNDAVILGSRLKQREQAAQQMLRYIQRGGKQTAKAHEMIQSWR